MPSEWTGPGLSPLQLYLREEREALVQITDDLKDAAADAQRRITALETKAGVGSVVRRAQLTLVRRELLLVQRVLWQGVGVRIRQHGRDVAAAAALAERNIEAVLFRALGQSVPEVLLTAQGAAARRAVTNYLARGQNNLSLSEQVFKSAKLASGQVDKVINRVILQGGSWRDLAKGVTPLIHPDTAGGVSYAAKRLGRTELNNAFHTAQRTLSDANPYSTGMQWHLSRSHPKADQCDALAGGSSRGRARGVYSSGEIPDKPHPQCLCFTASVPMDEDDFLREIMVNPPSSAAVATRQARTA